MSKLAAALASGLVRNHPYRDGNKRIGLLAMVTCLGINGYDFEAPDAEVVAQFLSLADGSASEDELSEWVREHVAESR